MKARATHWSNIGEAGFVLGMWFLYAVNRFLGRWPFRVALAPVVAYYLLKQRLARSASREYLTRLEAATGALGHAPTWRDTFRHITSFADTLLDKMLAVGGRFPFSRLRFEGREVMVESMAARRGGVLLTAHMGCLEACRIAAESREGLRLNVLVHTRHAERFNAVLQRLDPRAPVHLLQVTDFSPATAAMLAERVGRGEFVVIAGDRTPVSDQGRTVTAPFLGAPASFPVGPWVLAAALGCQVILFSVLHEGDGYRVRFERLHEKLELPRAQREEALRQAVADFARRLEGLCRTSPYDWFNFFPFWEAPNA